MQTSTTNRCLSATATPKNSRFLATELPASSLPDTPTTANPVSEEHLLGQFIPLVYHYNMLQDEARVGAFQKAIELIVQPGMHVVELGGGTGILSSFAARRGAKVTCVERNPELVQTARRFLQDNGLSDQVCVVHADALNYVPDRPVDAVVCEMLHVGLLREKQAQVISAFKYNYTKAFGSKLPIFLPEASILMAQLVSQSFDFAGYHAPVPLFQAPLLDQPRTQELSKLLPYSSIAYDAPIPLRFLVKQNADISIGGTVNAVRFVTQNVIAIDLKAERAITWPNQCLVLPIDSPLQVKQGDAIEMSFQYDAGATIESLCRTLRCHRMASPTVHARQASELLECGRNQYPSAA